MLPTCLHPAVCDHAGVLHWPERAGQRVAPAGAGIKGGEHPAERVGCLRCTWGLPLQRSLECWLDHPLHLNLVPLAGTHTCTWRAESLVTFAAPTPTPACLHSISFCHFCLPAGAAVPASGVLPGGLGGLSGLHLQCCVGEGCSGTCDASLGSHAAAGTRAACVAASMRVALHHRKWRCTAPARLIW